MIHRLVTEQTAGHQPKPSSVGFGVVMLLAGIYGNPFQVPAVTGGVICDGDVICDVGCLAAVRVSSASTRRVAAGSPPTTRVNVHTATNITQDCVLRDGVVFRYAFLRRDAHVVLLSAPVPIDIALLRTQPVDSISGTPIINRASSSSPMPLDSSSHHH